MVPVVVRSVVEKVRRVLEVDINEGGSCIGQFARASVFKSIEELLQRCVTVKLDEGGEEQMVLIRYEKLSEFYATCGRMGHIVRHCRDPTVNKKVCGFGQWLRAGRVMESRRLHAEPMDRYSRPGRDGVNSESRDSNFGARSDKGDGGARQEGAPEEGLVFVAGDGGREKGILTVYQAWENTRAAGDMGVEKTQLMPDESHGELVYGGTDLVELTVVVDPKEVHAGLLCRRTNLMEITVAVGPKEELKRGRMTNGKKEDEGVGDPRINEGLMEGEAVETVGTKESVEAQWPTRKRQMPGATGVLRSGGEVLNQGPFEMEHWTEMKVIEKLGMPTEGDSHIVMLGAIEMEHVKVNPISMGE